MIGPPTGQASIIQARLIPSASLSVWPDSGWAAGLGAAPGDGKPVASGKEQQQFEIYFTQD